MSKFCSNCGAEIKEGQDVCLGCGTSLNNTNTNVVNKKEKQATTGFVLGLVSIIAWIIPLFGYPITICGIVFSTKGLKSSKKTMAIIGLVLAIIFLLLTLGNSIAGVIQALEALENL